MINNVTTTLQAKHKYLNAVTHLSLRITQDELIMYWGFFVYRNGLPLWHISQIERHKFKDYPKLVNLHDGLGWNVIELQKLLEGSVNNFSEHSPTKILTLDS